MGQITSGVGLVSGIDFADLIERLVAIEARPKTIVQNNNLRLTQQQVAYQDINAKLLAHKASVTSLISASVFSSTTATSSDPTVLSAVSSNSATPGSYAFTVDRLVSTQQTISRGLADKDTTAVGAGTLTFEFGDARLDSRAQLASFNGGTGVQRGSVRLTDRSGASTVVDLSRALTVSDVIDQINVASDVNVTASAANDGLVIEDNTGSTATALKVEDIGAGTTASDLGLTAASVGDTLTGDQVNILTGSTLLSSLNDGLGVRILSAQSDFQIDTQDGNSFNVDLAGATTLDDVISTIQTATGGAVTASVNPAATGLELLDTTVGASTFTITALNGSGAAADLGIEQSDGDADGIIDSGRLIAAIQSKLVKNVNGGGGATLGQIDINNRLGVGTIVDLTGSDSVREIIDTINSAGAGVTASLNEAGNGLLLTDTTGSTASNLTVTDVTGSGAADLNIGQDVAADTIDSGNVQLRYLSETTQLSALNGGDGVARGKFIITDSDGDSATVDLTQGNETTINDVLSEINSRGLNINARINDNGDGILIEDLGAGIVKLAVGESGSSTAKDLGLPSEAATAGDDLVGTFERTVTVTATDTLEDVVNLISEASIGVSAVVINDGSATNPYRLSVTSKSSGAGGRFVFDEGGLGLGQTMLVEGRDARVFFGSADPASALAIVSSSNTLTDIVPGATIDLLGTSSAPVQVTINRDDSAITAGIETFVDSFNVVADTIDQYDFFDSETERRGVLLGDGTIGAITNALFRTVSTRNGDLAGQFNALTQLGITVRSGSRLQFDAAKFTAALQTSRDEVEQVFTLKETDTDPITERTVLTSGGIMARLEQLLERFTNSQNGSLQSRVDALGQQIQLGEQRVETIDERLDAKRARLTADFIALERTLASLQSQSSALGSLQPILFSSNSNNNRSGGTGIFG